MVALKVLLSLPRKLHRLEPGCHRVERDHQIFLDRSQSLSLPRARNTEHQLALANLKNRADTVVLEALLTRDAGGDGKLLLLLLLRNTLQRVRSRGLGGE